MDRSLFYVKEHVQVVVTYVCGLDTEMPEANSCTNILKARWNSTMKWNNLLQTRYKNIPTANTRFNHGKRQLR